MAKKKRTGRAARWEEATAKARQALDDLKAALEELEGVREEYEEWKGNLPENLEYSALGQKLEAVSEMDFSESILSEVEEAVDNAESADLPLGWGRD